MITAAITAAIGAILNFFGIEPGPYLVGVAIVVKVIIVGAGVLFGARWAQRRAARRKPPVDPSAGSSA
jgi:hypothetical protein